MSWACIGHFVKGLLSFRQLCVLLPGLLFGSTYEDACQSHVSPRSTPRSP